jgi:hypothetical protein
MDAARAPARLRFVGGTVGSPQPRWPAGCVPAGSFLSHLHAHSLSDLSAPLAPPRAALTLGAQEENMHILAVSLARLFTTAASLSSGAQLHFATALARLALEAARPAARAKLPKPLVRARETPPPRVRTTSAAADTHACVPVSVSLCLSMPLFLRVLYEEGHRSMTDRLRWSTCGSLPLLLVRGCRPRTAWPRGPQC